MANYVDEKVIVATPADIEDIYEELGQLIDIFETQRDRLFRWKELDIFFHGKSKTYEKYFENFEDVLISVNDAIDYCEELRADIDVFLNGIDIYEPDYENQELIIDMPKINKRIRELDKYLKEHPGTEVYKIKNNTDDMNSFISKAHIHFDESRAISEGQSFWDEGHFHRNIDILNNLNDQLKTYKINDNIDNLYNVYNALIKEHEKTFSIINWFKEYRNLKRYALENNIPDTNVSIANASEYEDTQIIDPNVVIENTYVNALGITKDELKEQIKGVNGDINILTDVLNSLLAVCSTEDLYKLLNELQHEMLQEVVDAYLSEDINSFRDKFQAYKDLLIMLRCTSVNDKVPNSVGAEISEMEYDKVTKILVVTYDFDGQKYSFEFDMHDNFSIAVHTGIVGDLLGMVPFVGDALGIFGLSSDMLDAEDIVNLNNSLIGMFGSVNNTTIDITTLIALDIAMDNGIFKQPLLDQYGEPIGATIEDYDLLDIDSLGAYGAGYIEINGELDKVSSWMDVCYEEALYVISGSELHANEYVNSIAD